MKDDMYLILQVAWKYLPFFQLFHCDDQRLQFFQPRHLY